MAGGRVADVQMTDETRGVLVSVMQPTLLIDEQATAEALARALVAIARQRLPLAFDAMDRWWASNGVARRQQLVFRLANALPKVDAITAHALYDVRFRAGVGIPLAIATFAQTMRERRKHQAKNSRLAQTSDWRVWRRWCKRERLPSFNPSAEQLKRFLSQFAPRHKVSSLQRWGSSFGEMHKAAGFENPLKTRLHREFWRTALNPPGADKAPADRRNLATDQAEGLTREQLNAVLARCDSKTLIGARDAAILAVTYDLMGRRSEVVALNCEDIVIHASRGTGIATIRRGKTDQDAKGAKLFLRGDTCARIALWLRMAHLEDFEGPLFRSLRGFAAHGRARPSARLPAAELSRIIRRRVRKAGIFDTSKLSPKAIDQLIARFSGHSLRVGSAQDMVAAGISDAEVMNAARWKRIETLVRYTQAQRAELGGMAKLAAMQDAGTSLVQREMEPPETNA